MTEIVALTEQNKSTLPDISSLSEEKQKKVTEIIKTINVEDSQFVLQYGVGAQSQIATFADNILNQVRAKDAGYAGDVLTNLMLKVKDLDVDSLGDDSFLSKIPLIGDLVDSAHRFIARYEKMSTQIEQIVDELDKARMQLLKDVGVLDGLFERNLQYLQDLDLFIIAGSQKLKELQEQTLPALKEQADKSGDMLEAQKFSDLTQMINRFEKKLHDLKLSRTVAIQTLPQIRLIQNNDQALVEKIQSSILNTIPLWKNQIVIAISLFRQKKALELQKDVTD
ncbi:MAG: toxic anion resistance protein, partial [Acidobacteriota bacterium]